MSSAKGLERVWLSCLHRILILDLLFSTGLLVGVMCFSWSRGALELSIIVLVGAVFLTLRVNAAIKTSALNHDPTLPAEAVQRVPELETALQAAKAITGRSFGISFAEQRSSREFPPDLYCEGGLDVPRVMIFPQIWRQLSSAQLTSVLFHAALLVNIRRRYLRVQLLLVYLRVSALLVMVLTVVRSSQNTTAMLKEMLVVFGALILLRIVMSCFRTAQRRYLVQLADLKLQREQVHADNFLVALRVLWNAQRCSNLYQAAPGGGGHGHLTISSVFLPAFPADQRMRFFEEILAPG